MGVLRRILFCVSIVAGVFALSAQRPASALSTEGVLFEIVGYYNPSLAEAQPLVHCIVHGGAVSACSQQFLQQEALEDPNVQRMLHVMQLYKDGDYPQMISVAGVGVACAWIDNPPVVCSQFAQVIANVGAAAINAQVDMANAVVALFGDAVASVGCYTGIYCDDDDGPSDRYDGGAEWQRCFQNRVAEGVQMRLSGGERWAGLIRRELPSRRFARGSLLAGCYPFVAEAQLHLTNIALAQALGAPTSTPAPQPLPGGNPFSDGWNQANPWGALPATIPEGAVRDHFADFVAHASAPLSDKYEQLVEDASAQAIDEAAQDFISLQTLWTARPDSQARQAVATMLTNAGPIQASIATYIESQRNSCVQTLSTPEAHIVDRWADSGAHSHSSRAVRGIDASNWTQRSPNVWCESYYAATFAQILTARKTAYDEALARGCHVNARNPNPLVLQCPALGGGMQRCRAALDGVHTAQCTLIPIELRPVPQQTAPDASESPPAATTTAPAQVRQPQAQPTPRIRPTILLPPATTPPETTQDPPG